MLRTSIPFVLGALLPLCSAQDQKWDARSFFPEEYNAEIRVDVGRLTDLGVTGQLLRSPVAFAAGLFREQFGFSIEELERVTVAIREFENDDDTWRRPESVWVMEGGSRVGIRGKLTESVEPTTIAGASFFDDGSTEMCSPAPGLLIVNSEYPQREFRVGSILRGEKRGGVPSAALLDLTTRRFSIATFVRLTAERDALSGYWFPGLYPSAVVRDDLPRASSLYVLENPKTGTLAIELLVRFQAGKAGADGFEASLKRLLETGKAAAAARPFLDILEAIEFRRDRRDVLARIELGSGREAVAKLTNLVLLLGTFSTVSVSGGTDETADQLLMVPDVAVEAPPEPAPAPVPQKKQNPR